MPMFPYDVAELADGPVRCLFAPIAAALPADLEDIIDQTDPYDPPAPPRTWVDFGATAGPFQVNRNIATASYNIQQTTTAVLERVTEVTRSVVVNVAEIRPDIMRMLENGPGNDTVATAAGVGAHDKVPFGNIEDLTQYRMAFIGRRGKDQGVVTEPAPGARPAAACGYVAYRVQLQADNLQLGFAEGDLAAANVTFRLIPEPGQPEGEEHGYWVFEDAGTFALMPDEPVEVTLGEHTVPVYAQRHAYLINRLGRFITRPARPGRGPGGRPPARLAARPLVRAAVRDDPHAREARPRVRVPRLRVTGGDGRRRLRPRAGPVADDAGDPRGVDGGVPW